MYHKLLIPHLNSLATISMILYIPSFSTYIIELRVCGVERVNGILINLILRLSFLNYVEQLKISFN